jgi:drug/metabolite transporter (DMT)-like permease
MPARQKRLFTDSQRKKPMQIRPQIADKNLGHAVAPTSPPAGTSTFIWLSVMVVLWGLSWPATKLALDEVPALWLATLRFASAGACLFVFVAIRGKLRFPPRRDWSIVVSIGMLQMMAFTGLAMIAMTEADASRAVLLAYTTPFWGVALTWLIFRRPPTKAQMLALFIGLVGVGLICSPFEIDWHQKGLLLGSALLLAAAICWSVVILHIRRHKWSASPLELAPWQMLLASIPLAIVAFMLEGVPRGIQLHRHLAELLVFIGPIATSACFVISAEYGRRISTFAMSNFTLGVPIVGIAASVVVTGGMPSPVFTVGIGLIILGMLLTAHAGRLRLARP